MHNGKQTNLNKSLITSREPELVEEALRTITEEKGVSKDDIRIVSMDLIPIRLQHIFRQLGKEGYVVKETLVLNGKLLLVAVRKGKKLDIAPDFEEHE